MFTAEITYELIFVILSGLIFKHFLTDVAGPLCMLSSRGSGLLVLIPYILRGFFNTRNEKSTIA